MLSLDGDPEYKAISEGLKSLQKARPVFPSEKVDAALTALTAALPDGIPPTADELFAPEYCGKAQKTAALFAGVPRAGLTAAFLRENWAHTCYFSPAAWAYYLPAFISAALGPDSRRDYLHSVLFMLQPDWVTLHDEPDAAHAMDGALGEAGARAVAAFLELAFDAPGTLRWETAAALPHGMADRELNGAAEGTRWQAAQALEWRFNRFETSGLAKARAFYAAHRDAPPPKQPDSGAAELAGLIRNAFSATPAPAPGDMSDSRQGTEPFEYAVEFRGRDWRGLSVEFLSRHHAALSFFSAAAFRYFIPAYLIHHLAGADWNADPVFNLTHGLAAEDKGGEDSYDWEDIAKRKFAVFSPAERAAIAAFLAYSDAHSSYEQPRIREALESYWTKPG